MKSYALSLKQSNQQEQPANLTGIAFKLKRNSDGRLMAVKGQPV